eukprot:TRINITY_DN2123_c0_g2_i3.p1 TRINITY_DN2123_c0_g2~~TRINITY_DN2123_c0_g2_i3.p1  ORF type:complete len:264 (-),score=24.53 TRINITY_DN2123_c0_g2_i3:68-859(-)
MYLLPPLAHRLFMVGGEGIEAYSVADIAFPVRSEIFSTMVTAIVTFSATISVIAFFQIWVRSLKDFHHAFLGLLYALIVSSFFQTTCKWVVGGLRPNFLSICKPDISNATGVGFRGLYYSRSVCTGDEFEINEGLQGFPSGHSSSSFAGFLFLSLYMNAKLKVFFTSPYRIHVWKVIAVLLPILAATLISFSRLIDFSHGWSDIIGGGIIGVFTAFMSYASVFRSILNVKTNHIPCKRKTARPSWSPDYPDIDHPSDSSGSQM